MATKPAGTPTLFAPDANYPAGLDPWAGSGTKLAAAGAGTVGLVPEQPINAQELNKHLNDGTAWDQWTAGGTASGDESAHIVETSSTGAATLAACQVGGTGSADFALTVSENAAAAGNTAIMQNTAGGACLSTEVVGGAGVALSATTSGSGAALEANALGTGSALIGSSSGALPGVDMMSAAIAGRFETTGTANAALLAILPGGAGPGAAAVVGQADGSGVGLYGVAASGYGVVAESDPTNPARASLRTVPQTGDPSDPLDGDHCYNTQNGPNGGPRAHRGSWHSIHTSPKGFVQGAAAAAGATLAGSSTSANLATVALQGLDTIAGANLMVSVGFDVGATAGPFTLRVFDVTGAPVQKAVRSYPLAAMSPYRTISYKALIPATDNLARSYAITLETTTATALDYGPILHHVQGTF
jgi:hypothetical protein